MISASAAASASFSAWITFKMLLPALDGHSTLTARVALIIWSTMARSYLSNVKVLSWMGSSRRKDRMEVFSRITPCSDCTATG